MKKEFRVFLVDASECNGKRQDLTFSSPSFASSLYGQSYSYLCGQLKAESGSGKDLQLDTYFLTYCIKRCFSVGMNLVMVGNFFMPFIFSWRYLEHHKYLFRVYLCTNQRPLWVKCPLCIIRLYYMPLFLPLL